jgi:hypothetical protein
MLTCCQDEHAAVQFHFERLRPGPLATHYEASFCFTPKELHAIGIRYLGFKIFGRPKMAEKPRSLSAFYINRQELGNKIGNIVFEPPKRFWLLGRVEPASRWVVRVPHRPAACLKLRAAAI